MFPSTLFRALTPLRALPPHSHTMDALNHVFSKLCELNSCHFNYAACTFGTGSRRKRKKKNDPLRNDGGGDGDSLVMQMQAALLAHNKGGKNADRVANTVDLDCGTD
jgi:hypothetical protein